MKTFLRLLSVLLVLSLISGCRASVSETGTAAEEETALQTDSSDGLFLSLTEPTSESLAFPLTKEQASRVGQAGADKVTWTLHRTETYANPADGNFIPLHGEDKMFPNEKETIDFAAISFSGMSDPEQPFSMERFETSLDGSTLKLDFTTTPVGSYGKVGIPHESGGRFLDICGELCRLHRLCDRERPGISSSGCSGRLYGRN